MCALASDVTCGPLVRPHRHAGCCMDACIPFASVFHVAHCGVGSATLCMWVSSDRVAKNEMLVSHLLFVFRLAALLWVMVLHSLTFQALAQTQSGCSKSASNEDRRSNRARNEDRLRQQCLFHFLGVCVCVSQESSGTIEGRGASWRPRAAPPLVDRSVRARPPHAAAEVQIGTRWHAPRAVHPPPPSAPHFG